MNQMVENSIAFNGENSVLTINSKTIMDRVVMRFTEAEDRLIGDRRPRNAGERLIRKPLLPWAPRLRRMRLKKGQVLEVHSKDQRHCRAGACHCQALLQQAPP